MHKVSGWGEERARVGGREGVGGMEWGGKRMRGKLATASKMKNLKHTHTGAQSYVTQGNKILGKAGNLRFQERTTLVAFSHTHTHSKAGAKMATATICVVTK